MRRELGRPLMAGMVQPLRDEISQQVIFGGSTRYRTRPRPLRSLPSTSAICVQNQWIRLHLHILYLTEDLRHLVQATAPSRVTP